MARSNDELEAQRDVLAARLKEIREEVQRLRAQLTEEELGSASCVGVILQFSCRVKRPPRRDRDGKGSRSRSARRSLAWLCIRSKVRARPGSAHCGVENVTGFTFRYIDPDDWERAFTVLIDVSTNRYRVKSCEPMVPQLTTLIDELNEDNNFFAFLRKMRDSFVQSVTK